MSEEQINDTITSEENTDQENSGVDVEAILAENAKLKSIIIRRKEKEEKNDDKPIINNKTNPNEDLAKKIERMELKQDGYPDEIIDEIMNQGGKSFIETKLGKLAIERVMEQHNAEKAVDVTSTIKSPTGKTITSQDLSGMSSAEMEKLLPKA